MKNFEPYATAIGTVKETGEQVACNYVREDVAVAAVSKSAKTGFIAGIVTAIVSFLAYLGIVTIKKKKGKKEKASKEE